ncbi:protein-L-isoaspartate O-methyltransferase family protein [Laceyella tengchongensis]|uniref:protein-L-isoaspartate O-methyltransferase family protein n=1 Tax=Laceyella tengchongensis TaxID=574699 RepID=UPI00188FA5AD
MSRVEEAVKAVNRDAYVLRPDGTQITQTTATRGIVKSLELLDVEMGMNVLEIGTGSGYSTALLEHLVGNEGTIVSIDIEPEMTDRAKRLFQGKSHLSFITKDGRQGYKQGMPYDRLVAWATAQYLPSEWVEQIGDQGIIVAPFKVSPIADTTVIARLRKNGQSIQGDLVVPGGYILMNDTPHYETFGPEMDADVVLKEGNEVVTWASAEWLRRGEEPKEWIDMLKKANPKSPLIEGGDEANQFRAFLLAMLPDGLTTAFLHRSFFIGISDPSGFALIDLDGQMHLEEGSKEIANRLGNLITQWLNRGKPSYDSMRPAIRTAGGKSWVRLELKKP